MINSGSGNYFLIGGGANIPLIVNMSAAATAEFDDPPIPGAFNEDGAGSEGYGFLTFSIEAVPEPGGLLMLVGSAPVWLRRRRSSASRPATEPL